MRSTVNLDPKYIRPQRKRSGHAIVPYIDKYLELMETNVKGKCRKPIDDEIYMPFKKNGVVVYAYFKNNAEYTRYINCLEAKLIYTTYYDQLSDTFYAFEFTQTQLSVMQMAIFSQMQKPFEGEFYQITRDSNKFGIIIKHPFDKNISFMIEIYKLIDAETIQEKICTSSH